MMKKTVLFVAAAVFATATFAQDGLTSKKGEAYLPEAGDWAIGFDATPFMDYASNGNLPTAGWVANNRPMTIVGKMFKDESTAYRAKVRIGFGSSSSDALIDTNASGFGAPQYLTNSASASNFNITLGGGLEKRKGNTRLQGFYGAEALISFGSTGSTNDYEAALSDNYNPGPRVTEITNGSTLALQIRSFIGVEYFFAPKISISAEYGWGLMLSSTGGGEVTTESFGLADASATANSLITTTAETGGSGSFGIDTDNNGGVLTLMFHF